MKSNYNLLPSVDKLLSEERIKRLTESYPHEFLVSLIREHLERARSAISKGNECPSTGTLVTSISNQLQQLISPGLRPLINATGVVLHTNLGRAPMSPEAINAMSKISLDYSNLEFNIDTGNRGSRHTHIEQILCRLSGAEAAMVVNNNASAVLLALSALAKRKEVIVSRGEAVEIGGSFRIPDVMRQSGAKLVEIGTTNATYVTDYEEAINPRTAALMRVHSSNFKVVGFTHSTTIEELAELGRQHGISVLDDLGSGCFLDTTAFGLDAEPMVQQSISAGVNLAMFSGDKLVGGPQAGIIVGDKDLVDKLKKHPLARAVRIDKIRLAGLTSTLIHYLKGEALVKVPVWRMISTTPEELRERAQTWAKTLGDKTRVITGESMIGGGSLPGGTLPTYLVAIGDENRKIPGTSVQALATRMRRHKKHPVIGRISDNALLLDPRTVLPEQDDTLLEVFRELSNDL